MVKARKLVGAVLAGAGAGIMEQARTNKETQLMRLRRKWQREDQDRATALTRETRDASAALTREGWDRGDARARMATSSGARGGSEPTVEVVDPKTGQPVVMLRSQAIGMKPYQPTTVSYTHLTLPTICSV